MSAVFIECDTCDGTGDGPCANCGDRPEECACDDPAIGECDVCDGMGKVEARAEDLA